MTNNFIANNRSRPLGYLSFLFVLVFIFSPVIRLGLGLEAYLVIFVAMLLSTSIVVLTRRYMSRYELVPASLIIVMCFSAFVFSISILESIFYLLISLTHVFIAYWLVNQDQNRVLILFRISLYLFFSLFLFLMFSKGYTPDAVNQYFLVGSRNVVSATALFFQLAYSASYYRVNGSLPKITPFFTLVISVISFGRSGIGLSFLFLSFSFIFSWKRTEIKYISVVFILFVTVGLFSGLSFEDIEFFLNEKTNFSRGFESPRALMIDAYFEKLSVVEFFIGRDLSGVQIIADFEQNPHNSFIYGHSHYGISYVVFISWFLLLLLWCNIKRRSTVIYSAIIFVFLARLWVDSLSLPGIFDYIFYYLFFLTILESKNNRNKVISV